MSEVGQSKGSADLDDGHERLEPLDVHRCLLCVRVLARVRVFGGAHMRIRIGIGIRIRIRIRNGAITACYFTEVSMSDDDGITAASPRSPGQPLEVAP
ncbi:hypothetical protein FNV64_44480 [Streptomyces sp. S1A1-7]|uniref:hypothetical protein n=1 Tax=Streptomyces sp. S1A1-7 TaxID=2594459 RepID=UPI0011653E7E|nr:hypothetical protein [Streptomyces sp. S1A1-7]QDN81666.1 hypothetical protein FNV64_44480 [Streptomyces sp. S1A1-7]